MSVKYLAYNPVFHDRMKHVQVDYHFLRDQLVNKLLGVRFISLNNQITDGFVRKKLIDGFTKAMSQEDY
jgi:hypothetical protein